MKAVVAVKRVLDYAARVRVKSDQVRSSSNLLMLKHVFCASMKIKYYILFLNCNSVLVPRIRRVRSLQSGVDLDSVKMSMNPFCEIALEAALRLKEAGYVREVVAATVGDQASTDRFESLPPRQCLSSLRLTSPASMTNIALLYFQQIHQDINDLLHKIPAQPRATVACA